MSVHILEIYSQYNIKRDIQEHMFRVAAVASMICDYMHESLDKNKIISVCLLHDMGNLIKDSLNFYPKFFEPEGVEYWKGVREEFVKKYGTNPDQATISIVQELNIEKTAFSLLQKVVLKQLEDFKNLNDWEMMTCKYADVRVSPTGILPFRDRLQEWQGRNPQFTEQYVQNTINLFSKLEKDIFAKCKIKPEDITEEIIQPIVSGLRNFVIK